MKRMKKCLACILVMALVLSTTCSYAMAASFSDLQDAIDGKSDNTAAASEATPEATPSEDAPKAEVKNEAKDTPEANAENETKDTPEANAESNVENEDEDTPEANAESNVENEDEDEDIPEAEAESNVENEDENTPEAEAENVEPAATLTAVEAPESKPENPTNGTYIGTDKDGNSRYGYGWDESLARPEDVYDAIVEFISSLSGWFGIEAWTKDGERNVKLNDTVQKTAPDDYNLAWSGVTVGKDQNVNLDLNGNDINSYVDLSGWGNTGAGITVNEGGTLTVNDSSNGKGTITGGVGGIFVNGGIVTMTGGTISGNTEYGGVYVKNGGSFTMNGGAIENNKTNGGGGGVAVEDSDFTMTGGTISGNEALNKGSGGGVAIGSGSNFTMNGGTIENNKSYWNGGGVAIAKDAFFTMINGIITGNMSTFGGGVTNQGDFTMTGGTISDNTANASKVGNYTQDTTTKKYTVGGGGGVVSSGTFELSGGEITGNVAQGSGGGISVGEGTFTMKGGIVSDNTAQRGTGGGITIVGNAEGTISGGSIIGNQALPLENDLASKTNMGAGGGIYVEKDATLNLTNVIITQNYASSMGGGLAACPTGRVFVFGNQGAAIYDNSIGEDPGSPWGKPDKAGDDNVKLFIEAARDIYTVCWKDNDSNTNGGALIGNIMLSNVNVKDPEHPTDDEFAKMAQNLANWEGYVVMADKPTEMNSVGKGNNGTVFGDRYVVLTANPSDESKQAAMDVLGMKWDEIQQLIKVMEAAKEKAKGNDANVMDGYKVNPENGVLIAGNVAGVGGGVAINGTLHIGKEIDSVSTPDDIEMEKKYVDEDKNNVEMEGDEFSFTLTGGRVKDGNGNLVAETQKPITVKNDSNGDAVFQFAPNTFTKPGTYVFYVTEDQAEKLNGVEYDGSRYKVTIEVKEVTKDDVIIGSNVETPLTVKNLVIGPPTIQLVEDKDGKEYIVDTVNSISFTNTKTAEETEDPKNPDTEDPKDPGTEDPKDPDPEDTEDPKDPGTEDPKNPEENPPEEEIPDEETPKEEAPEDGTPEKGTPDKKTPKAETPKEEAPEAEIPDEDVPLANVPEELTELPDEDVPLADVPEELVDLPDEDVPLADAPEELVEIPDEDVPLADAPKTGDNAQIWGILAVLSGAGLAWLALEEQKRKTAK